MKKRHRKESKGKSDFGSQITQKVFFLVQKKMLFSEREEREEGKIRFGFTYDFQFHE